MPQIKSESTLYEKQVLVMNDGHRRPPRLSPFILKCFKPFGAVLWNLRRKEMYVTENLKGLARKLFRIPCWFVRLPQCSRQ
jgi:hypothetical protein